MTITESRLKRGVLTFGDDVDAETTFACQATNVRVAPSYDDDGDAVETLCGDEIPAGKKESWIIAGTSIQDFDNPEGFLAYCYTNAMTQVPFTWQPNPAAPTFAGQCVILAVEEGGDVNTRLDTDWEFEVAGRPTRTYAGSPEPEGGMSASQEGNTVEATVTDNVGGGQTEVVRSPGADEPSVATEDEQAAAGSGSTGTSTTGSTGSTGSTGG